MGTEAPNTLKSRAKFHVIDIVSEGPIKGLAEGTKSIYLDNTPIRTSSGSLNFKTFKDWTDLIILPRAFLPDQTSDISSGFSTSMATESVNAKVTKDVPEGSGSGDGSVSREIENPNLDAIRVTLRVPALFYNNPSNGDTLGTEVEFKISVQAHDGNFKAINNSSAWTPWAIGETMPAEARGLHVKAEITQDASQIGLSKHIYFQFSKFNGATWGDWKAWNTFSVPSASPSASEMGYWSLDRWTDSSAKVLESTVTNLPLGIYRVRVLGINCTATIVLQEQFGDFSSTISGKCVAPYDASFVVPLPPGGSPWTVKVERITDDRVESNYNDDLFWLSYTELLYEKFAWPYLAGFELTLDAEDFSSLPERAYDIYGLLISIPSNYNPYARTYTGVWDGTFIEEWSDNPAWILFDLVKKKRYGLGDDIPESYLDTLKWTLYSIAQYCDEQVTVDGDITEPRYTCSVCINSQQEAYDLLNTIVSTFRGMLYPAGDGLVAVADRLTDPVINIGPANVIDGIFTYQGPARKTIHTAAYVTWNNPDDGYRLNTSLYEHREGIRQYGYRIDKINAIGACSKSLALRLAKWKILTEVMAPDTVTYRASFDHLNVMPSDIVNISDPAYTSEELIGRIKSITNDSENSNTIFELDRSVVRIGNDESLLQLTLPDQTILSLDVSVVSTATGDEITVPTASVTTMPNVGAIWLLSKETVRPRMWRVFHISEAEPNIYEVSASLVEPTKWDLIENGWNFEPADYTGFPSGEMPPPVGVYHSEFLKKSGSSIVCCVNLSWSRPNDARASLFRAEYRKENEPWKSTEPILCQNPSIDIFNIDPGVYDFRVQAQDSTGLIKSEWTYRASQTILGKKRLPENVTNFTAEIEKYGVLFNWSPVSDIDLKYYEIRYGTSWADGTFVARVSGTTHKWEDATESAYTFWIKAFDGQTPPNESETATRVEATISVEATPVVVASGNKNGVTLEISGNITNRFAYYEIQRKQDGTLDSTAVTINSALTSRTYTDPTIPVYYPPYQYRARAFNKNLNPSLWSKWSNAASPTQIAALDVSRDLLRKAIGSVATWSASNCTTESIAELSGVKDVSGNALHGQAHGSVVVATTQMGNTFQMDGDSGYIDAPESVATEAISFAIWINPTDVDAGLRGIISTLQHLSTKTGIAISQNGTDLQIHYGDETTGDIALSASAVGLAAESFHQIVLVFNGESVLLYLNGELFESWTAVPVLSAVAPVEIGRWSSESTQYKFYGHVFDPRLYSRALSATEIKSLYMFPGDVAFGRITSDLLTTGVLITLSAQIAEAIINNAHISSLDAAKITTGTIDAGRLSADIATLRQLAVMGKNLIEDPSFLDFADDFEPTGSDDEYTFGRWTIGADTDIPENTSIGSATYLAVATHEGQPTSVPVGKGVVITPFAATNRIWLAQRVVVAPSTAYAFSAHVFKGWAENAACPPFQLVIEWYGSAGKISQTAGYKDDVDGGRFEISGTSPLTTTHAILYLIFPPGAPTSPAFYMCAVSALQLERSEDGATFWVGREQGTIYADRIFTGIMKALNYSYSEGDYSDAGMSIDLDTGIVRSRQFAIDAAGSAKYKGDISGATGTFAGQVSSGATILSPTDGSQFYGAIGASDYVGYFSIYVRPLGTLAADVFVAIRVRVQIGDLLLEIGGGVLVRAGNNAWQDDVYVNVLAGNPIADRVKVRFKTATSGSEGFYIVVGNNNNWGYGYANVIETNNATGSLTLENASGTIDKTVDGRVAGIIAQSSIMPDHANRIELTLTTSNQEMVAAGWLHVFITVSAGSTARVYIDNQDYAISYFSDNYASGASFTMPIAAGAQVRLSSSFSSEAYLIPFTGV
jgi:predicted phage tail protein